MCAWILLQCLKPTKKKALRAEKAFSQAPAVFLVCSSLLSVHLFARTLGFPAKIKSISNVKPRSCLKLWWSKADQLTFRTSSSVEMQVMGSSTSLTVPSCSTVTTFTGMETRRPVRIAVFRISVSYWREIIPAVNYILLYRQYYIESLYIKSLYRHFNMSYEVTYFNDRFTFKNLADALLQTTWTIEVIKSQLIQCRSKSKIGVI